MKSISQVAKLTGVSIRTLQYYDEIGLLKPSELTVAGYRMYDDTSKLLVGSAENYCRMIIDTYSNDYLSKVFDTKHGAGSSEYIVRAFRYYSENNCTKNS